jgi:hypothetical protein
MYLPHRRHVVLEVLLRVELETLQDEAHEVVGLLFRDCAHQTLVLVLVLDEG